MKDGKLYGLDTADIHFGKRDDERLYRELNEVFLAKINKEGESLDYVQINGDLYDRQIKMNEKSAKLLTKFVLELNELSIKYNFKLRFLRGTLSHDYNQLEIFRHLEVSNPNFRIFNTVTVDLIDPINEITFLQIPEEYVEDFDGHYGEYLNLEEGKWDMIKFHGTFDFAGYIHNLHTTEKHMKNAPTFKVSQFEEISYGPIIGGHIHTHMSKKNVYYSGSFSRYGFGEEESKGFLEVLYDFENLEYEVNFIENELAPTYVTVNLEDLPKDTVEKTAIINEYKEDYDYVRIKSNVSVDSDQDLEMLKRFSETDESLKIEVTKEVKNEDNKEFEFVTKREYDDPTTIQKYISIKNKIDVPLDFIKEAISD